MTRALSFGLSLIPVAAERESLLDLSRAADDLGFDFIGIEDHPYVSRYVDTWTLIAWLAGQTKRVRFVPDVANLPLRGAAMLAKSAASLDVLTGGRVELAIGAGWAWDRIEGMGGPRRTQREAFEATEDAIDVIKLFFSGQRPANFEGHHYSLRGVHPGPRPAHDIEIWVGASGPKMLDLIGRKADGWIPSYGRVPVAEIPEMQDRIADAATAAGRSPDAIRGAFNVGGAIGDGIEADGLAGPAQMWAETLAGWSEDLRMDTFIFWPTTDPLPQVRRFADQVVPLLARP